MQELAREDYARTEPLFDGCNVDLAWLEYAWKDDGVRLFVDEQQTPRAALLCPQTRNTVSFLSGDFDAATSLLHDVMAAPSAPILRFISLLQRDWAHQIATGFNNRFQIHERITFRFAPEQLPVLEECLQNVPSGLQLQRVDVSLAERIAQHENLCHDWNQFWPQPQQFVEQCIGFCLLRDDEVLSVAFSRYPVGRYFDVGVETSEAHRGQRYAVFVGAALLKHCWQQGVEAFWSTHLNHKSSLAVAKRLGFDNGTIHLWLR